MNEGVLRASRALVRPGLPSAFGLIAGLPLALWLALASGVMRFAGAVWDVSWHRTVGRDTFWSPPHLVLYAGVALATFAAAWALAEAVRSRRPWWRYGIAVFGAAMVLASAPFDDLWHALYGRDVDIWSPPHLTGVLGSTIGTVAWTAVALAWRPGPGRSERAVARSVLWIYFGFLLYSGWFALNWYQMVAATRDALLYPALVGLVVLPFLVAARAANPAGWAATAAATAFIGLALLPIPLLEALGWRAPAFPPMLVVPALALDGLDRRLPDRVAVPLRVLALGLAFALLFVLVELVRMQLVPPGLPHGWESPIAAPYLQAAAQRPWTPSGIAAGLPLVALASVAGAAIGWLLRDFLARAGRAAV